MPRKVAEEKAVTPKVPMPEATSEQVGAPASPPLPPRRRSAQAPSVTKKAKTRAQTAATASATATAHAHRGKPRTPASSSRAAAVSPPMGRVADAGTHVLLAELRAVKDMLRQLLPPRGTPDAALEGAVHSVRRLLSELIEEHLESMVRDLVDLRRDLTMAAEPASIFKRLDGMIEQLGAVRFEAEPMDVVDPMIHVVLEERRRADAPDGVILETLRPGYRTSRGLVLCKAAVAVNRNA